MPGIGGQVGILIDFRELSFCEHCFFLISPLHKFLLFLRSSGPFWLVRLFFKCGYLMSAVYFLMVLATLDVGLFLGVSLYATNLIDTGLFKSVSDFQENLAIVSALPSFTPPPSLRKRKLKIYIGLQNLLYSNKCSSVCQLRFSAPN